MLEYAPPQTFRYGEVIGYPKLNREIRDQQVWKHDRMPTSAYTDSKEGVGFSQPTELLAVSLFAPERGYIWAEAWALVYREYSQTHWGLRIRVAPEEGDPQYGTLTDYKNNSQQRGLDECSARVLVERGVYSVALEGVETQSYGGGGPRAYSRGLLAKWEKG